MLFSLISWSQSCPRVLSDDFDLFLKKNQNHKKSKGPCGWGFVWHGIEKISFSSFDNRFWILFYKNNFFKIIFFFFNLRTSSPGRTWQRFCGPLWICSTNVRIRYRSFSTKRTFFWNAFSVITKQFLTCATR